MVSKSRVINWTNLARERRTSIFIYWNKRNKSLTYSKKLNFLFSKSLNRILISPEASIKTNSENIRAVLVRDYYLIFEITEFTIKVLDIWDTRQNPQNSPKK
jgi:hypothetical protein